MLTPNRRSRRSPRRTLARSLFVLGAAGALLAAVPAASTSAAPIDDLRAQAAQLESQMNDIGSQLGVLYEQIKATEFQIDSAKQTIADSQTGIQNAQAEVTRVTALVRERAATVYRSAGSNGVSEFDTDIREQASRRKYANATSQRDDQLLVQLARAKEDLATRQGRAERLRADLQKQQDSLKAQEAEFDSQKAALEKIKSGIDGQIAQLVAQERARRAAAEAAAAATRTSQQISANIPPVSGAAGAVVAYAAAQLGKPYCYAGVGPDCYDCSGLTQQAWAQVGVYMPHNSESQYSMFPRIPLSQIQPGDLAWFPGHIGIYAGNGQVINATHTGDYVRIHPISLYHGTAGPAARPRLRRRRAGPRRPPDPPRPRGALPHG
ncbi:MAG: NlpC/P60 family protein, partial [Actinomycetota bacterium]